MELSFIDKISTFKLLTTVSVICEQSAVKMFSLQKGPMFKSVSYLVEDYTPVYLKL